MAGIYIHIPFCKQACHYCDFHFSTQLKHKDELVAALLLELQIRRNYLGDAPIDSIYFGGGSPSILPAKDIAQILQYIVNNFEVNSDAEITLEANPDDLNKEKLKAYVQMGINRLSIGIQSFIDRDLIWMNRAHNSAEAKSCIKRAQDIGIENLSVDLIYGLPELSDKEWQEKQKQIADLWQQKMKAEAGVMDFEKAEFTKRKIEQLENYQTKSVVYTKSLTPIDVFSIAYDQEQAYVSYLMIKDGKIIQTHILPLSVPLEEAKETILAFAIHHFRNNMHSTAQEIEVPIELTEKEKKFLYDSGANAAKQYLEMLKY